MISCSEKYKNSLFSYLFIEFDKFWLECQPKDIMEFNRIRDLFENIVRTKLADTATCFKVNIEVDTVWAHVQIFGSDHKKVCVFKNAWFQKHWSYTSLKTCSVINLARRWRLLAKGQYCDLLNIILGYRRGQVGSKGLFHTGKLFLSVWDETSNNHKDIIAIAFVFMSLVYSIKQFWIKRKGTWRCSSQISKVYKTLRDLLQLQLCLHFQQYRKKFRQVQRRFVYFLYFAVINAWLLQPVHLLTYISRVPTNVAGMGWSKMIKDEAFICENV